MFGEKILDYWDDIMKDLGDIIAIPSVAQPQDGPYPFGKDAATAVDKAIEIAERYGIKTKNSDYYAMHAELGEGEENAVVMAHLDVVPAGEGWDSDPYTMVIRDGKAFGRGVSDNKGPAIVALHCLRALKEAGVVGKRKLRVVLGSAEEIGMQDMGHYFSKEQMPTMGFTPDACYGVCHCEKGLFRFAVTGKVGKKIVSFKAGTVVNAVPYKAEADVLCDDDEFAKLVEAANAAEVKFDITRTENGEGRFDIDIRYPATKSGAEIDKILAKSVEGTGLTYTLISDEPPLYLPKDGPLVSLLSGAYEDVTGKKCDVFSMGGGTYARQMGGAGVAFGASFDEEESNAHQANECINLEQFKLHAQICLEAMYRMFTAD